MTYTNNLLVNIQIQSDFKDLTLLIFPIKQKGYEEKKHTLSQKVAKCFRFYGLLLFAFSFLLDVDMIIDILVLSSEHYD